MSLEISPQIERERRLPHVGVGVSDWIVPVLLMQRGHLLPWVPVCLALGIGLWFGLPIEPSLAMYGAVGAILAVSLVVGVRLGDAWAPLSWALTLVAAGFLLAGARANTVEAPKLSFRYYGPIEGRVVGIDRSASDALRVTLADVRLEDIRPDRTPARVRVSVHGDPSFRAVPGSTVILTGHLSPPGGPVEPGGFDFQRHAWFKGLGAVGYTRTPVLIYAPPDLRSFESRIFALRMHLSSKIQAAMPGATGGVAAAILTGDRSGIPRDVQEDLRSANLAHLLAISGLHMGLLTGLVFGVVRYGFAAFPSLAMRMPVRRIAALIALTAGAAYLVLSGASVATLRAFVMVAVMLVAVVLGHRAISLRSVAIAAILILIITPEALLGPGFQMSFAATTALVAVFALVWKRGKLAVRFPRWSLPVIALIVSSAVAGAATAPYAAAHFNRIADYGLLANLLSVPLMGALIMPAAIAAVVLAPLGLSWIALTVMGWGLGWILFVAQWVTGLSGAVTFVVSPGPWVLPILSLGGLTVILCQGHVRWGGLIPVGAALWLWHGAERPEILIAESGGLIGVQSEAGRVLSKPKGDGFAARVWLENDGDGATQAQAAARTAFVETTQGRRVEMHGLSLRHVTGRGASQKLGTHCDADIVVTTAKLETPLQGGCAFFDPKHLRSTGAIAIYVDATGRQIVTARDIAGDRLWNR